MHIKEKHRRSLALSRLYQVRRSESSFDRWGWRDGDPWVRGEKLLAAHLRCQDESSPEPKVPGKGHGLSQPLADNGREVRTVTTLAGTLPGLYQAAELEGLAKSLRSYEVRTQGVLEAVALPELQLLIPGSGSHYDRLYLARRELGNLWEGKARKAGDYSYRVFDVRGQGHFGLVTGLEVLKGYSVSLYEKTLRRVQVRPAVAKCHLYREVEITGYDCNGRDLVITGFGEDISKVPTIQVDLGGSMEPWQMDLEQGWFLKTQGQFLRDQVAAHFAVTSSPTD